MQKLEILHGSHFEENDIVYFSIGDYKDVYKQILKNPQVEIVAYKDYNWLRYTGKVVLDDKPHIVKHFMEIFPGMKNAYNEKMVTN